MGLIIGPDELDQFVIESDRLGGPVMAECQQYWAGFTYVPRVAIDQGLDPFGDDYMAAQLGLYREVSGRELDQTVNEATAFSFDDHVGGPNPYNHSMPSILALQIEQLTRAFRFAGISRSEKLLDMGSGWGLSSETAAYLGLDVLAVDINPDFVRLVNMRAARSGLPIRAVRSAFDEVDVGESRFDLALFYECLHHAVSPWRLLERIAGLLGPSGRVILAGEPINEAWWRHWGMRLDPMSVYCIRKFGWFESGWSLGFITACLERAGFVVTVHTPEEAELGLVVIGRVRPDWHLSGADSVRTFPSAGWSIEDKIAILVNTGWLEPVCPEGAVAIELNIGNYRGKPIDVDICCAGRSILNGAFPPGDSYVVLPLAEITGRLDFVCETWSPAIELGVSDDRLIGIHLRGVKFV